MKNLLLTLFSFLFVTGFAQTKDTITTKSNKNDIKTKTHKCSEYFYRISNETNEIDTVLVVYCFYDDKRKKVIHKN